jgi:hypothetical protein
MAVARQAGTGWRAEAPRPVGALPDFLPGLIEAASGAPVALGLDVPLGVPREFAWALPDADFPSFLARIATDPVFFQVASVLDEVSPARPFYPARGVRGMTRAAHAARLGLASAGALNRACDRATAERPAGAPPFWTLGANQSGKAAIAAWRDMLGPALRRGLRARLWPFDGPFRALLAPGAIAVAETYPAEGLRHLGLRLAGSKRRQADRAALGVALLAGMERLAVMPSEALRTEAATGFGADAAGEDRFDCVVGLLCLLNVLAGNRPDTAPDDVAIRRWEGWVLGQTALPFVMIA